MRETAKNKAQDLPVELLSLYQRIECNARTFGMSPEEVEDIKKACKIAYQHKLLLEKAKRKYSS